MVKYEFMIKKRDDNCNGNQNDKQNDNRNGNRNVNRNGSGTDHRE